MIRSPHLDNFVGFYLFADNSEPMSFIEAIHCLNKEVAASDL